MTTPIKIAYYFALTQTLIATLTSLYFSEIVHVLPCILCWYQRILMFPLVIIISIGILLKDKNLPLYVLPVSVLGMGLAFYHYLLQQGIVPATLLPCQAGVSCSAKYIVWGEFVTIPLLALIAFTLISICMILAKRHTKL